MQQRQDGQEAPESEKTLNCSAELAERLRFELCPHEMKWRSQLNCVKCVEAVIREAIEKTIEEAIAVCDKHFKECRDRPNCHLFDADVIRSLKRSNAVAEDEGPCAACGQPKSDSAMHLDSPGKGWGAALHWFKQSNSGMEVRK